MRGERCAGKMNIEEQNAQGGKVQVGRGAGAREKSEGGGGCVRKRIRKLIISSPGYKIRLEESRV